MYSTPTSHSGSSGFLSWSKGWLWWLKVPAILLSLSKQMLGSFLKLDHEHFLFFPICYSLIILPMDDLVTVIKLINSLHLFSSSSWLIMLCNSLCGWIILESCKISEVEVPDSVCPLCTLLWVGTSLVLWLETEELSVKASYTSTL